MSMNLLRKEVLDMPDAKSNRIGKRGTAKTTESSLKENVKYFKAMSHGTRLKCMYLMLEKGEISVSELVDKLGESQPKVSRQLGYLRNIGMVITLRREQWIFYSLSPLIPNWIFDAIKQSYINKQMPD